ncbi:MAG: HD domain-containing protein [Chloroflexi bacterium]|nr:HD domain-containing protein [Chloroflexota bacterium]
MPTIEQARTWYPNDPVHGFDHVLRVYHLAEHIAKIEGADIEIVRAAVLLHDVESDQVTVFSSQFSGSEQKVVSGEKEDGPERAALTDPRDQFLDDPKKRLKKRKDHHLDAAEFADEVLRAEGWDEARIAAVCHCIRAHRFRDKREPPQTLEAQVVFDADKLDAIGATGVARAIAYATRANQPAYAPASQQFIKTGELEPGEAHSAFHEHLFKLIKIKDCLFTSAGRRIAKERHRFMCAYFDRLVEECASDNDRQIP